MSRILVFFVVLNSSDSVILANETNTVAAADRGWQCVQREPSVAQIQAWVSEPYRDETLLLERSRWGAMVPQRVRVQVSGNDEGDWYSTRTEDEGWRRRLGGESRLGWRIDAEWDFSQWIEPPRHLTRVRIQTLSSDRRRKEVGLATGLFYQRRRSQWAYWRQSDLNHKERAQLWWRIQELTSLLDAKTSGRLSAALRVLNCLVAGNKPLP